MRSHAHNTYMEIRVMVHRQTHDNGPTILPWHFHHRSVDCATLPKFKQTVGQDYLWQSRTYFGEQSGWENTCGLIVQETSFPGIEWLQVSGNDHHLYEEWFNRNVLSGRRILLKVDVHVLLQREH